MKLIFKLFIYNIFISIYANSHPLNTTYIDLELKSSTPTLDLYFYIYNLEAPLMLSSDATAKIVKTKKEKVIKYIQNKITITNNGSRCILKPVNYKIDNKMALDSRFKILCNSRVEDLRIDYRLFFGFDKTQEGIMQIALPHGEKIFIFSPHQKELSLKLLTTYKLSFKDFKNFIIEGMWHIWVGIDHIMFLLMLLLPSVLVGNIFKTTLVDVLKVVTAFTLSHSITLFLSMHNILNPAEQAVETLIAITVLLTALNNLYPIVSYKKEWLLAFGFGFIHGFGFANAMHGMQLNSVNLFSALFGFNIGVEIGQIVIVLTILPVIYLLSKSKLYKQIILPTLSILIANIALLWAIDRAFNLRFMPF